MTNVKFNRFSPARLNDGEVTPRAFYLRRREFMAGIGALAATGLASAAFADPLKGKASSYTVDEN